MPATCAFSGTPASISARQPPHTEAIDDEPFDSVISGDHAHRVREVGLARQHRDERALGQAAVADFAALGRADAAGFAGGERRHVVVQHEVLGVLAGQRVDALRVARGAERGDHQRLRFAAGEQGRAVGARQHAVADLDRRTVRVSRPSMRGSPARIWLRTIFASMSNSTLSSLTLSKATPSPCSEATVAAVTARVAWVRACFERIW